MNRFPTAILLFLFAFYRAPDHASSSADKQFAISRNLFVGYQGWFRCAGDATGPREISRSTRWPSISTRSPAGSNLRRTLCALVRLQT
jgi:hypothetical protein